MAYEIETRELMEKPTAEIHVVAAWHGIADALAGIFGEVMEYVGIDGIGSDGIAFGRYTPRGAEVAIEAGFTTLKPVAPSGRIQPGRLPGGEAAVCLHVGPYGEVAKAYEAVQEWIAKEGRKPGGPPWEAYLSGPDEDPPRTEVVFPLLPRE